MMACNLHQNARSRGFNFCGSERILPLELDDMLKSFSASDRRRIGSQIINGLPQSEVIKIDKIVAEASRIEVNKVKCDQRLQVAFYFAGFVSETHKIPIPTIVAEIVASRSVQPLMQVRRR